MPGARKALLLLLWAVAVLADRSHAQEETQATPASTISFTYEILGNAIVGQPIAVNLFVAATDAEMVTVEYRINDPSSMVFAESQARRVEVTTSTVPSRQQITVVPQREGRLYLNVAGQVETDAGTAISAAAIPIPVSAAPESDAAATPDGQQEQDAAHGGL